MATTSTYFTLRLFQIVGIETSLDAREITKTSIQLFRDHNKMFRYNVHRKKSDN